MSMNIKLYRGDCLIEMGKILDHSIDMILCDLPYGTTACKWDVVIPFEPLWEHYWRVLKPNGAVVLFGSQPFTSILVNSQIKYFKYEWIWSKNIGSNFASVKYQPMKEHENILVFSKGKTSYNPIMQPRAKSAQDRFKYELTQYRGNKRDFIGGLQDNNSIRQWNPDERNPSSIQHFDVVERYKGTLHPTQKPAALLEYLIKTYTNPGEIVLDNCMGSGSTGIACINLDRNFIGIEKDEKYFKIAHKRIRETVNNI